MFKKLVLLLLLMLPLPALAAPQNAFVWYLDNPTPGATTTLHVQWVFQNPTNIDKLTLDSGSVYSSGFDFSGATVSGLSNVAVSHGDAKQLYLDFSPQASSVTQLKATIDHVVVPSSGLPQINAIMTLGTVSTNIYNGTISTSIPQIMGDSFTTKQSIPAGGGLAVFGAAVPTPAGFTLVGTIGDLSVFTNPSVIPAGTALNLSGTPVFVETTDTVNPGLLASSNWNILDYWKPMPSGTTGTLSVTVGQYAALNAGISESDTLSNVFTAPGTFGAVTVTVQQGGSYYFPIPITLSTDAQAYQLTLEATPFGSMPDDFGNPDGTYYALLPDSVNYTGNLSLADLKSNGSLVQSDYFSAPAGGLNMNHSPYTLASTAYHGKIDTNSNYQNLVQIMPQMLLHLGTDVFGGTYTSTVSLTLSPVYAQ